MKKNDLYRRLLMTLILLCSSWAAAQEEGQTDGLPRGYQDILLGESMESVKEKLLNNRDFSYRGEAEVQLLEREGVEVIETAGVFLSIGHFFSLKKNRLWE
jgi:hypothetical protein